MPRITELSLSEVNRAFGQVDDLKKQIGTLKSQLQSVTQLTHQVSQTHQTATTNNLSFVWTGSTLTLSWAAGSVLDRNNVNVPVTAGAISGLVANTYYWLAWNRVHQQMVAQVAADGLLQNPINIVICQVFTGTAGQTGVAGGGASSGNSDLSGARYKLF